MVMEWVVMVQFFVIIEVMLLVLFHIILKCLAQLLLRTEVMAVIEAIQLAWVRVWIIFGWKLILLAFLIFFAVLVKFHGLFASSVTIVCTVFVR